MNNENKYYCDVCGTFFKDEDLDWNFINACHKGNPINTVCPTEDCMGYIRLTKNDDKEFS